MPAIEQLYRVRARQFSGGVAVHVQFPGLDFSEAASTQRGRGYRDRGDEH
jgi:hypothetical protein